MSLTQLIYVSRLTQRMSMHSLRVLVQQSAANNARADVTGVLLVHGHSLMQLLEGDATTIEKLFAKIARDPRHRDVEALLRKPVSKRLYPEWGMGLTDLTSRLELDRGRMSQMVADIQRANDTHHYSIEARVLLRDFQQQAEVAV